ncbi:MAG: hypothetical protein NWF04_05740 [Candidatus Bathyarchaeota archaeon]|nr:hypothetical protein [Candidatus Bathyarchaeota archaeon]
MSVVKRVVPILPERVVDFAWGLMRGQSKFSSSDVEGDVHGHLRQIRQDVQSQVRQDQRDLAEAKAALDEAKQAGSADVAALEKQTQTAQAQLGESRKDLAYVDNVRASLDATEKNLITIFNGRNLNFDQTKEIMKTQIENINSSARAMANFHSALPRLFATGSGAAGTVLVSYILETFFGYQVPELVIASTAALVASASYGIYQWKIAPKNVKRAQRELIRNDYQSNLYYHDYIHRVFYTLSSLFDQTLNTYENIYDTPYQPDKYADLENRKTLVWSVLGTLEGICGKECPQIHADYHNNKITPEIWPTCETAQGYKNCALFTRKETSPTDQNQT